MIAAARRDHEAAFDERLCSADVSTRTCDAREREVCRPDFAYGLETSDKRCLERRGLRAVEIARAQKFWCVIAPGLKTQGVGAVPLGIADRFPEVAEGFGSLSGA